MVVVDGQGFASAQWLVALVLRNTTNKEVRVMGLKKSKRQILGVTLALSMVLSLGSVLLPTSKVSAAELVPKNQLSGGLFNRAILKDDGTVWATGFNAYGELGDGTSLNKSTPVQVSGLTGVTGIFGSDYQSFAVKSDGTLWGWGLNNNGQLGDGTLVDRRIPVQVAGLQGVIDADGGRAFSIAADSSGNVWSWGMSTFGELGTGVANGTRKTTPVKINSLSGITAVSTGSNHAMALKSDGTVWTWGFNREGELGDGTIIDRAVPVKVSGLTNVIAVKAGSRHSMALKSDGTVWAWGHGREAALGDGTSTSRLTPNKVYGLTNVTAIAVGLYGGYALKSDGTVYAWGLNYNGQIGDGTVTPRWTAVKITGLSNIVAISDGWEFSSALDANKKVYAWGQNNYGQLGDGTTTNRLQPVASMGTFAPSADKVTPAVDSATSLANGDLSTQSLIDAANKAISDAQALVTALPDGATKTSTQASLDAAIAKVQAAQNILDADKGVATAITLANADLSTQASIDSAKKAISDAQALVAKLSDGAVKMGLQAQLDALSAKVQSAQDVLNTKNAVANAVTVSNGDLTTQLAIDTAKQTVLDAQALVSKLPDGAVKTGLQAQLDAAVVKVQLAQDVLIARNGVVNATTSANGDLTTQPAIDVAKQAISDAQALVTKLPTGAVKTTLQTELEAAKAKVQLAEDILNAKKTVVNAVTIANGDLTTQSSITTANQAIADAQLAVNKLPVGELKTSLQTQLDAITEAVNIAQATMDVKTAEQTKTQSAIDTATTSVSKLQDGAVKTSLTERLVAVQKYININNMLDTVVNTTHDSYASIDQSIQLLNAVKIDLATYPAGAAKDELTAKYNQVSDKLGQSLVTLLNEKEKGKKEDLSSLSLNFLVEYAIKQVGATSIKDRGAIHGFVMPLLHGKATGNEVNQVINSIFE
jgi:alpha-tubulin suppressor-like RCC1 family protein